MKVPKLPSILKTFKHEGEVKGFVIEANEFRHFVLSYGPDVAIDEEDYIARNPDVAEAISAGSIASGSDHYKRFGYFERRPARIIS